MRIRRRWPPAPDDARRQPVLRLHTAAPATRAAGHGGLAVSPECPCPRPAVGVWSSTPSGSFVVGNDGDPLIGGSETGSVNDNIPQAHLDDESLRGLIRQSCTTR